MSFVPRRGLSTLIPPKVRFFSLRPADDRQVDLNDFTDVDAI